MFSETIETTMYKGGIGMMRRSKEEIQKLIADWESDPCWDLYETEGFEAHREELKAYQKAREAFWEKMQKEEEKRIDERAEKLGIKGLYRLILKQQEEIEQLREQLSNR